MGRKDSPETIAKRVASFAGYKHDEATREKMRAAQTARWARERDAKQQTS